MVVSRAELRDIILRLFDSTARTRMPSSGRNTTPWASSARRMAPRVAAFGTQRSSSKSSTSRWHTDAEFASLQTDQLSKVRAERHWEAVIIIALFPFALVAA